MSARFPWSLLSGTVMVFLFAVPLPASAHARLTESSPTDGAKLTALPKKVVLKLSDPVAKPAYVVVSDAKGRRVNSESIRVAGRKVSSVIVESARAGAYTMSYRIVSADAHVVTGTVRFSLTQSDSPAGTTGRTTTSPAVKKPPAAAKAVDRDRHAEADRLQAQAAQRAVITYIAVAAAASVGLVVLRRRRA